MRIELPWLLVALATAGCARMPSPGESGSLCADGRDNDMDGLTDCMDTGCASSCVDGGRGDAGPVPDSGFRECAASEHGAELRQAPVDIVFVIDNSGSMSEEAALVQANLNRFVLAIEAAGLGEYRVLLVTRAGFVRVPDPLGSDGEHLRYVPTDVQSTDSFERVLGALPAHRDFLRASAITHFVFVTDDDSEMPASRFMTSMRSFLGHDFFVHAITSPPGERHELCLPPLPCMTLDGCTGPHGDADDNGDEYWQLAGETGGARASICSSNWTTVFEELLRVVAVPRTIPCTFELPELPAGTTFDPSRANVVFTPAPGAEARTIPRAASGDCSVGDRWVYDDPASPTQIELCPAACREVEAATTGSIRIEVGCQGLVL